VGTSGTQHSVNFCVLTVFQVAECYSDCQTHLGKLRWESIAAHFSKRRQGLVMLCAALRELSVIS